MSDTTHPMPESLEATATPLIELDPESRLTPTQITALDLMATGATDTDIAQALTVARKTLYNWRTHHPTFKAALADRREHLFRQQSDRLRALLTNSLSTLETQLKDPYAITSHRAAKTLLTMSQISKLLHPTPEKPTP